MTSGILNKMQSHMDKAKDAVQPSMDKALSVTQPHINKAKDIAQPHLNKIKDNIDDINGKHLEEKIFEYTSVYGEILLGLHEQAETDRQTFQAERKNLQYRVDTLEASVREMQFEVKRLKGMR